MTWSPEQEDASELKRYLPFLYIYVPRCFCRLSYASLEEVAIF